MRVGARLGITSLGRWYSEMMFAIGVSEDLYISSRKHINVAVSKLFLLPFYDVTKRSRVSAAVVPSILRSRRTRSLHEGCHRSTYRYMLCAAATQTRCGTKLNSTHARLLPLC